jgi:hypothetical protein
MTDGIPAMKLWAENAFPEGSNGHAMPENTGWAGMASKKQSKIGFNGGKTWCKNILEH